MYKSYNSKVEIIQFYNNHFALKRNVDSFSSGEISSSNIIVFALDAKVAEEENNLIR